MAPVTKVKLTVAYDGGAYSGWQVQKVGRGVQEVIEQAIQKIFGASCRLHGSSRTDTGVHALGMVAHVELPLGGMDIAKVGLALNAHLPEDIRIMAAARAHRNFHARFDATGKQYRYFVWNHFALNPLLRDQAWLVPQSLDLAAMRTAAAQFVGKHDFAAFAGTRDYTMKSTVRTVHLCEINKKGPLLTFIIEGDGFLYRMCRGIAGTIVQVGQGKFASADISRMIEGQDRSAAGMTAPAKGLVLWKVFYRSRQKLDPTQAG
jgi:tRNA pseudouridine38-40 synthase